jgi:hypothetical protein
VHLGGNETDGGHQRTGKPLVSPETTRQMLVMSTLTTPMSTTTATARAGDAPTDAPRLVAPRRPAGMAIYESIFTRRRIAKPLGVVRSPQDAGAVLRAYLCADEADQEHVVVALLNIKHVVIGVVTVYIGNASGAPVRVGEVFRDAVRLNASAVVVAHNHPSGDPAPSADDLALTRGLAAAGRLLDIELLDHIILGGDGRSASLRALGAAGFER